ncbi:DUF2922 domain-containing protein [Heyndrickxia acidicola]|jgi:hypothetical protein|uniref:DUF2922 domain-containing protein n=1 Tax=Heyndrickxia acidicola TaxID=209389 RepID=A0ABU6MG03_9BACI|nr:DUF2922 domain-containing protein [Heyndrickxia acidicola]MED1203343.1 DUF2922 domain-containing protein [Heyndrickxia acidicola]
MKTLELQFVTEDNKTVRIAVDEPIEPVDTVKLKDAMNKILASNVQTSASGLPFTAVKGARLIEQNVSDYTL